MERGNMNWSGKRLQALVYSLVAVPFTLVVLSASPRHVPPQNHGKEIVLSVDPDQSKVHWTLGTTLHTVHGTFAFKSGALHLDPVNGIASGEIAVFATSGESGNDSRDKKMHKDVLESGKFPDVIFRPDKVEGRIAPQGAVTVLVHGLLILHGSQHEMTVPVQAELAGDHWTGTAKFNVPFIDWDLKNPSNFLLKVDHVVNVELELKGSLQNSPASL
jgi:polyisoprenoid-binding protein YceI